MATGLKTGGRQKGSSNKLSGTVKEMISKFVENEMQHLPELLNKMKPKEKVDIILKLLPFIVPKIAQVDAPNDIPQKVPWAITKKLMNMTPNSK